MLNDFHVVRMLLTGYEAAKTLRITRLPAGWLSVMKRRQKVNISIIELEEI